MAANLWGRAWARHTFALTLAVAVLLAAVAPLPPLIDAATGAEPADAELVRPVLYTILAPISNTLDALTFMSLARAEALLITVAVGLLLWGALRAGTRRQRLVRALVAPLGVLILPAATVLLPRPVPRVAVSGTAVDVLDYHAHTAASHDGRTGWTAADLARWHAVQGFTGSYVTDHNVVFAPTGETAIPLLPGVEWSLFRLHLLAIGPVRDIDRRAYGGDVEHLLTVFAELRRQGALSIGSLPEYWRNHREGLGALVVSGIDGFEIVNCSPKGLGFDPAARADVVRLARARDLMVVGASDNHGWGHVTCVWNLTVPGARGAAANRVVARPVALAQGGMGAIHAVVSQPWLMLRALSWPERMSWLTWIALVTIYRATPARQGQRRGLGVLARSLSGRPAD